MRNLVETTEAAGEVEGEDDVERRILVICTILLTLLWIRCCSPRETTVSTFY